MPKNHLKRLVIPNTWNINKKGRGIKWIIRPDPGPHNMETSVPLLIVIRDLLKFAKTAKEVRSILTNKTVLVDGRRIKDPAFSVGLMDVVEFVELKQSFRVLIGENKKFSLIKVDDKEKSLKICKIKSKKMHKGKVQLGFNDGRTIIVDKDVYKTGDSVLLELPKQNIKEHLKQEVGSLILLTDGKHMGKIAMLKELEDNKIKFEVKGKEFETVKGYSFVLGKKEPVIKLN